VVSFEHLQSLVAQAAEESGELDTSNQALEAAKAELSEAQGVVAQKHAAVDEARTVAGTEQNDLVAKIQEIIAECQSMLASLQE